MTLLNSEHMKRNKNKMKTIDIYMEERNGRIAIWVNDGSGRHNIYDLEKEEITSNVWSAIVSAFDRGLFLQRLTIQDAMDSVRIRRGEVNFEKSSKKIGRKRIEGGKIGKE